MKIPTDKYDNIAIITIVTGFLLAITLPYLLTNWNSGITFGLSGSNPIGDTIGGTTAPVIGLVGAILVYLTLKEQIKANQRILDQFELNENDKKESIYFTFLNNELDEIIKFVSTYKELNNNLEESKVFPNLDFSMILNHYFFSENENRIYKIEEKVVTFFFYRISDKLKFYLEKNIQNEAYNKMIEYKIQNLLMLFWGNDFFGFLEGENIDSILRYKNKVHIELFYDLIEFKYFITLLQKRIGKEISKDYYYLIDLDKLQSFLQKNSRSNFSDYYSIQIEDIDLDKLPPDLETYKDLIS